MDCNTADVNTVTLPLPAKVKVGAISGAFGRACVFPMDMIKTRLQSTNGLYAGPTDCARQIFIGEGGLRGFYKGLGPNLVGVTPEKAIQLAVNEALREHFQQLDGTIALHHEVLSGAGAGTMQCLATNPMEMVKIRMQMQALVPLSQRKSAMEVVKKLGMKGMYQGSLATLCRDVPFAILFFPGYANLRRILSGINHNLMFNNLIAGTIAGAMAAGTITPLDVIKTRLQMEGGKEKYQNMGTALRTIVKEEGIKALYKGDLCALLSCCSPFLMLSYPSHVPDTSITSLSSISSLSPTRCGATDGGGRTLIWTCIVRF